MKTQPFTVNTAVLRRRTGNRIEVSCSGAIDGLETSGAAVEGGQASFMGTLEAIEGDRIVAVGDIKATWNGSCRRCLQPAAGVIAPQVREIFEPQPTEGETYPLGHDVIDLEAMVREAIMLELPVAPVCRDDCGGICPQCGQDLSSEECNCSAPVGDPRWAALDALKNEG